MDKKNGLERLEGIDVNHVNKKLRVFGDVPAYALLFFFILFFGILSFSFYVFIISFLIFLFLFESAIYFTKKNLTFLKIFSMIGYIFKPKFIIIRKKEKKENE